MDISCIISSGDLELYVLGMLPEEDLLKMEQLILLFPELKEEADQFSHSLEAAALQSTLAPAAGVKDQLFHAIQSLSAADVHATPRKNENKGTDPIIPAKLVKMKQTGRTYLVAASIIGLVLTIGAVSFAFIINQKNRKELAVMEQQVMKARADVEGLREQNLSYEQLLQILQDDNFLAVPLKPVPGKPDATVKVYWNKISRDVYIVDASLPRPVAGKQYQLWAIVDGKPVSAGLLSEVKNLPQKMQSFEKADAFAITLEPTGGSATPTMEEMFVMGTP